MADELVDKYQRLMNPGQAAAVSITGATGSPDEAAKTLNNSVTTGVPFSVGNMDPKTFNADADTSAAVANVNDDPVLARYMANRDYGAHVSRDDTDVLSSISPLLKPFMKFEKGLAEKVWGSLQGVGEGTLMGNIGKVYSDALHGLQGIPGEFANAYQPPPEDQRTSDAAVNLLVERGVMTREEAERAAYFERFAKPIQDAYNSVMNVLGLAPPVAAGVGAWETYGSKPIADATGIDQEVIDYVALAGLSIFGMKAMRAKPLEGEVLPPEARAPGEAPPQLPPPEPVTIDITPYRDAGEAPPPGVHPESDKLLIEESKTDNERFQELLKAVKKSKTLERSPEAFNSFLEEGVGDKEVWIPKQAIAEILGDKGAEEFNWLPTYAEQMRNDFGDLRVPLKDLLSHGMVIADAFKDDIRFREGGLTSMEADELSKVPPEAYAPREAPIVQFRKDAKEIEAGLEPVKEGDVRLYRGNRPGERGTAFTNDLPGIALPFRKMYGGELHYVDVPEADLAKYENKAGTAPGAEFNLPQEIADKSQRIETKPPTDFEKAQEAAKKELWLQPLFPDKPPGMTEAQFAKYSKDLEQLDKDANEAQVKFAARRIGKELTREWKEAEAETKANVERDLTYRPTMLADEFFRSGMLGVNEHPRFRLDAATIEKIYGKELAESLPKSSLTKEGGVTDLDSAAALFQFPSANAMIYNLQLLENARRMSGLGPKAYFNQMVNEETARRMEQTHGVLSENILAEARESIGTGGRANLLADEMMALGRQIGLPESFTKEFVDREAKRNFGDSLAEDMRKPSKFIQEDKKAGIETQNALQKGDMQTAFQQKLRQGMAAKFAIESRKFAKDYERTTDLITRAAKGQEMAGVDQEHFDQLRSMLQELGIDIKHPIPELKQTLQEFVNSSEGKLAVASWLKDPSLKEFENLKDMTVNDFRALSNSIRSMIHVGRNLKKVMTAHGAAEFDNAKRDMIDRLNRFDLIDQPLNPSVKQRIGSLERKVNAMNLLPERILDYTDQFDRNGPFNRYIDQPLRKADAKEIALTEEIVKMRKALNKYISNDILDSINNTVLPDSLARSGFLNLNRNNLRNLIGYMGSASGREKVVRGFFKIPGVEKGMDAGQKMAARIAEQAALHQREIEIWRMIHENATEDDFKFVNGMHEIYDKLYDEGNELEMRESGVPLDQVEPAEYSTKFGKFNGGYWPVFFDKTRSNIENHLASKNGLFEPTYIPATTPQGWTVPRTRYFAPLDLTGSREVAKIQGMVHDISFREAVRQVDKFVRDADWMAEMNKKWSKEYAAIFGSWVRDIANVSRVDDSYAQGLARFSSFFRQNIISTVTFLNPGTYIKHTLTAGAMSAQRAGVSGLLTAAKDLVATKVNMADVPQEFHDALKAVTDPESGGDVVQFILDSSALMRRRQRLYQDTLRGAFERGKSGKVIQAASDIRQASMYIGRFPVQIGDATSTYPLWYAAYKKAFAEGAGHEDAVLAADKEVTRAHGTQSIIDKAAILRTGEAMRWVTPLYNFWNHMQNNYLQMRWDIGQAMKGKKEGEEPEPGANTWSISSRIFWLVILPIAIEEFASPALDEDRHSIGHRIAMATVRQAGAGYAGLREFTNAWTNGYEPSVGMLGTVFKMVSDFRKDVYNAGSGAKAVSKDWFTHLNSFLGAAIGVSGTQVGRTGTGIKGWFQGTEKPGSITTLGGFNQYRQLIRTGHTKARTKK